jgi:hypothetical protein
MPAEQATQQLAALQAAYDPPPVGVHATTPTEAAQRLAQLEKTPDFLRKLEKGHVETTQEWQRLCELKAGATAFDPLAGEIVQTTVGDTGSGSLTRSQQISSAADLRAEGCSDQEVAFILSDQKHDTANVAAAQWWLPRMQANPNLEYPGIHPADRERFMKYLGRIITIGDGSRP